MCDPQMIRTAWYLPCLLLMATSGVIASDCVRKTEEREVRGTSLAGVVEPGATVRILYDFYHCNKVERGDIVAYHYAGNAVPIIKIVKGLPGDKFDIIQDGNLRRLRINGKIAVNSRDEPYEIGD